MLFKKRNWLVFLSILILPSSAFASNFQDFFGLAYSNPAELTILVKDYQHIFGDFYVPRAPNLTFTGTVMVPDPTGMNNVATTGTTSNSDYGNFPYGRIAKRISKQTVVGVDVTKPFSSDIIYPSDSAVRYSVTKSGMNSTDIAPNIAHQFSGALSDLSVGAGLDAMYYTIDLDGLFPSFPTPTAPFGSGADLSVADHAVNWGFGWHLGLLYHLFKPTFVGLSYFSQVTQKFTNGSSDFTGFPSSSTFGTTINLPATTNLSIMQTLSDKWTMIFKAHYIQWSSLQQLTLSNIAGPSQTATLNLFYKDTWRFDLGTRYKIMPKLNLGLLLAYDETPTPDLYRTLALPGVDQYIIGVSAEYQITKTIALEALYGHVFSVDAPFNNVDPNTGTTTVGTANIYGNAYGLQLTVNL